MLFWSYKLPKYDESSGKSVRAKAGSLVAKAPWKDLWKHHASTMKYTLYNPFEHRSKVFLLVASGSNRVRSAEPSACNRMCPCMCFKRVSMGARVGSKSVLLNAVSVPAWRIIAGETCQSFCQAGRTRPFSMQCLQVCVRAQQLQERSQWRAYFYEFLVLIIQVVFQQILQVQSVQGCTASLFLIFMLSSF